MTEALSFPPPDPRMDVYSRPQLRVAVNSRRRLNLMASGEGGPTVILAAGFMGGTFDWIRVQPYVARFARVVSFDNAGLGFSDPGPLPRTSGAIVDDLHAALQSAGLPPPYVLAGHSAGGLRLRLFAARYPQTVAGMVMIDTVVADWEERFKLTGLSDGLAEERTQFQRLLAESRAGILTPKSPAYVERIRLPRGELTPAMNKALHEMWTRPSYLQTAISESTHLCAPSSEETLADRHFGDLPLVVLSAARIAGEPFMKAEGHAQAWFEMHDAIAALSTRGVRRVIDCGHNIPIERPREVVAAIEEVVTMARS